MNQCERQSESGTENRNEGRVRMQARLLWIHSCLIMQGCRLSDVLRHFMGVD